MTTEQINDIRYALNVADIDDNKAWDALNALLAELDAAKQLNADWEAASLVGGPRIDALRAELDAARQHNEALETVLAQHNDFGALFQPGGRFYEEANLTLGSSAVRGGGAWLVEQLDAAREAVHYANGVADLAMKHRDAAEAREAKLREAAQYYMSQFGQALEANDIPYGSDQVDADAALRTALEGENR